MKIRIEIDDFIRISFPYAPEEKIRNAIKRSGYRWYSNGFFWGKRNSGRAIKDLIKFIDEFFPDQHLYEKEEKELTSTRNEIYNNEESRRDNNVNFSEKSVSEGGKSDESDSRWESLSGIDPVFSSGLQTGRVGADSGQSVVSLRTTGNGTSIKKSDIKSIRGTVDQLIEHGDLSQIDRGLLEKYEGAGGLKEKQASASGILSEFFTPQNIIDQVWKLVDSYAPNSKTVLEPAAGTGRFAKNRSNNQFTFYEVNPKSAKIAAHLYPDAIVYNKAFQSQFFDDSGRIYQKQYKPPQYDIVIGNPPYGIYSGQWKGLGEGKEHNRYEEYFIDRGLDSLKEGGILAFVVPSGFLRSSKDKIKNKIAAKGNLIDAWRLPNGIFPTTDVGTDIIVLRKEKGNPDDFCNNTWFLKNRDKILGNEVLRPGRYGMELYVTSPETESFDSLLKRIVPSIEEPVYVQNDLIPESAVVAQSTNNTIIEHSAISGNEKNDNVGETDLLSAEMFCQKYHKTFNKYEKEIWQSTSYSGIVDIDKISPESFNYLNSDESNYIEERPGRWLHKEIYTSGYIQTRLSELDTFYQNAVISHELYEKNKLLLETHVQNRISLKDISFSPQTSLAKEFKIATEYGEISLVSAFKIWATGQLNLNENQIHSGYFGYHLDWAESPLKREDFPPEIDWSDIYAYLNGDPVRSARRYNEEDKKAAALEAEKKRQLRRDTADKLFNRFLQEGLSEENASKLEIEWNKRFNSYTAPDWSKLPLYIDGMSKNKGKANFTLYNQQLKGISFLCNKGNGLLAYDVGVGKTAAGIVATVNQIQSGRSQRPLIIVPKAVYAKWVTDFKELFPDIKINDLGNFSKENIEEYQNNNHGLNIEKGSVSVCTNEALQRLSFKDETIETAFIEDFSNLLGIDDDIENDRERAKAVEKISKEIGTAIQAKDGFVFFEECEFDHVTVDEAHRFKNLYRVPRGKERGKANEYAGLGSGTPSARALKLFAITQYIQRENNNRNVFLLTATPFTNSPLEVYSMLSYIARKKMLEMHIYDIKDFLNEYAEMKTEWAVTPKGDIQPKQVMKNFRSLKSLQNLLGEYIDKVDAEEAGVLRPRKITHVQDLNLSDLQKQIIAVETQRMSDPKAIKNGGVLVAINNMRMAMLSPALLNPDDYNFPLPDLNELVESSPKLKFVCDTVTDCYKECPNGGQVIYMPRGVNEAEIVKKYLIKSGLPENAIGLLNASVSKNKKESIIEAFNNKSHPLKVIIGSETISEGVDLNGNSFALYNTMLGWNPTETIQVEGRIWRQGNEQGHCHIIYPLMNDSVDSLMYQKHDEKSSRINALWSYKGDKLNVEDISPEELKFDLIKDPLVKAEFVINRQVGEIYREKTICDGKIRTIYELKSRLTSYHYHSQTEKIMDKLKELGVVFEDNTTVSINNRINSLAKESDMYDEEIKTIKARIPEIAMEFMNQEQIRRDSLPSNAEIQKQLSNSILTNLKNFKDIKHELKTEIEKKKNPENLCHKIIQQRKKTAEEREL